MTEYRPGRIDAEDIHRIVAEAQQAVRAVDVLPGLARSEPDRAWARFRAEAIDARWASLLRVMREGDGTKFSGVIDAIIANSRPLEDAPESMTEVVEPIRAQLSRLADDVLATIDPLIRSGGFDPPTLARFAELLPPVADEFR